MSNLGFAIASLLSFFLGSHVLMDSAGRVHFRNSETLKSLGKDRHSIQI